MSRPLVISDCDEVLLHMVAPFKAWVEANHGVHFSLQTNNFAAAMRHADDGRAVEPRGSGVARRFLRHPDACPARDCRGGRGGGRNGRPGRLRDPDQSRAQLPRGAHRQLADLGIHARVFTNQGPKGPALKAILEEYKPSRALFIDDLPEHHHSAASLTPEVMRLHLCGEPLLAPHIDCATRRAMPMPGSTLGPCPALVGWPGA
jgi:hypothetical protein